MQNTIFYLIISQFFIILISLSGIFFVQKKLKFFLDKNLHYLVSFSAGVFCFLIWEMFWESEHIFKNWKFSLINFIIGFLGIYLVTKFFPQIHQHHDSCCNHSHQNKIQVKKVLIGDAFHNIGDGIIITTSFLNSFQLGINLTISILIHEFLQEISEFFVLKEAGYSTKKALTYNFFISFSVILGVIIGFVFCNSQLINSILLSLTSGIFFNVVINDLIPHNFNRTNCNSKFIHLILILAGVSFMFILSYFLKH